jgi:hypothetical protein
MKIYDTEVTTLGKEHLYINGECYVKNVYVLPDRHTFVVKHYGEIIPVYRMSDHYTDNLKFYARRFAH